MCSLTPEIIAKLKKPFAPEDHKDREIGNKGQLWFYITWQKIRERVEEIDPNYLQKFDAPNYLGDYCYISCTLTIHGVSRQAIGNAKIELISKAGNNMERGNCIERAIADAFKNAAESFGVGAYLDDQNAVIKVLSAVGDSRAYKYARDQQQVSAGLPPVHSKPKSKNDPPEGWKPAYK